MNGPQHFSEAEQALAYAEQHYEVFGHEWYLATVAYAQAHATLALVAATVGSVPTGSHVADLGEWREVLS